MKVSFVVVLLMGLGIGMAAPPPKAESDKVVRQLSPNSVYTLELLQLSALTVQ